MTNLVTRAPSGKLAKEQLQGAKASPSRADLAHRPRAAQDCSAPPHSRPVPQKTSAGNTSPATHACVADASHAWPLAGSDGTKCRNGDYAAQSGYKSPPPSSMHMECHTKSLAAGSQCHLSELEHFPKQQRTPDDPRVVPAQLPLPSLVGPEERPHVAREATPPPCDANLQDSTGSP